MFLFLPKKILAGAGGLWQANAAKDRYTQMREMAEERLRGFGKAFHGLAKVFGGEEETRKQEISALVDTVAEKVCQSCGMAHYCWDEEVYRTYSMTFSALSCCDGAGRVTTEQLPAWFQELCPRKKPLPKRYALSMNGTGKTWSGQADCRSAGIWWGSSWMP